jgi:nitrite reductase/ring-hydroxylating ferredoxin subunit
VISGGPVASPVRVASWSELPDRTPVAAAVDGLDLVIVRRGDEHSVFYGRCPHRGALLADGSVVGNSLVCGLHGWDYRVDSGVSEYDNDEVLAKFTSWRLGDDLMVDRNEVTGFLLRHPQPFGASGYQARYQDTDPSPAEPFVGMIRELAAHGLERTGHDGPIAAMGVPRDELPSWGELQLLAAQLDRLPLLGDEPVATEVCIGPNAKRPLWLEIPLLVSDMSYGALSLEAKTALAKGAQLAGTAICSGEGGMLPEEQEANDRYLYELASGRFGWSFDLLSKVQAFHFKGGQAAKTGTGGHLPGAKVIGRIAEVRGLPEGTPAISPARFPDLVSVEDFRRFADEVRSATGGIPIGFKLSAQHIEQDIDAALAVGVDYLILDGRGGSTGAAPLLFRDNISVPTIPALARARRHLDAEGRGDVTLVITGGLRTPADFVKALALGADAIAIANSALQAIGCLGMRACHTDNCPVGIATQKPHLRARLPVEEAAERLGRFLRSSVELMAVLARACGHRRLADFSIEDLTTASSEMALLSGASYAGVGTPSG